MSSEVQSSLTEEDLVTKLSNFGLTKNQAKVYLSIIQLGITEVGAISKTSMIHRQDVYKILPTLEKKGLIVRLLGKPVSIEALPMPIALGKIVIAEELKAKERIKLLKNCLKELRDIAIASPNENLQEIQSEPRFTLLSTDKQLTTTLDLMSEEAKKKIDLVLSAQILKTRERHFLYNFPKMTQRGVSIRLILQDLKIDDETERILQRIRPKGGNFIAKFIRKKPMPYRIVDEQDLLINRRINTESGSPQLLWTNARSLIDFYSHSFEEDWNNPAAITFVPTERDQTIIIRAKK